MSAYLPKLYDVVDGNPFRDITLDLPSSAKELRREHMETWDCFTQKPLQPPGSLSQFFLCTDPLYSIASVSLRNQLQKEKLLEIHERVEKELVGRRWSRKKIQDALSNQINAPSYSELVEQVLGELYRVQKIILHRKTKSISFVPSDLRLWKSDTPIFVGDDEGCWSYEVTEPVNLLEWLTEKEDEQWKLDWPTADGKLEDLKAELQRRSLTAHASFGSKLKKEDWARTLGRCQAIETLVRLQLKIQ
jgi:hypothetical protein